MPPLPAPLVALLRRQARVVSRAQALRAGLTAHEVDRLVTRRRWRPVHPRVYLVGTNPLDDEAGVRAAVLWAGDGAVLAGLAAAWWHGLVDQAPRTVGLTVPRRHPAPRPGVRIHRRIRSSAELVTLRGLIVPVRPLAALEAAVEAGAAGPALLARLPTTDRAALNALDAPRRHGTAALLLGPPGMDRPSESLQ